MIAKHLITDFVPVLQLTDSVAFALARMDETRLAHVPVVNGGEFSGILAEKDAFLISDPSDTIVNSKVSLTDVSIQEGEHIYEVVKIMVSLRLTMLPVVTVKNQLLGAITVSGLLPFVANIAAVNSPGGIIVLEINNNDYNLTEISQIVEANDARIMSLYLTSFPDSTRLDVTIKVNLIEIGPILQTFFRYNYLVKASWSKEDSYTEGLQDRFDALMNYLNI